MMRSTNNTTHRGAVFALIAANHLISKSLLIILSIIILYVLYLGLTEYVCFKHRVNVFFSHISKNDTKLQNLG